MEHRIRVSLGVVPALDSVLVAHRANDKGERAKCILFNVFCAGEAIAKS